MIKVICRAFLRNFDSSHERKRGLALVVEKGWPWCISVSARRPGPVISVWRSLNDLSAVDRPCSSLSNIYRTPLPSCIYCSLRWAYVPPRFDQSTQSNDRDIVLGKHDKIEDRSKYFFKNFLQFQFFKILRNDIKCLEYLKILNMMSNFWNNRKS